jgi:hypothetical protein
MLAQRSTRCCVRSRFAAAAARLAWSSPGHLVMARRGYRAIEQAGGLTVVQDPKDAAFPEMPENALMRNNPDHVVHLRECRCFWMHWFVGRLAIRSPPDSLRYEVEIR